MTMAIVVATMKGSRSNAFSIKMKRLIPRLLVLVVIGLMVGGSIVIPHLRRANRAWLELQ